MEIKKKNQHFDAEILMNEAEIQSIVGMMEELCMYKHLPFSEIKGLRAEIYTKLSEVLAPHPINKE